MSRELLIEQILPQYRAWIRKVASGLLSPTHEALDDLCQEASIAMWRAVGSFDPDASPADFWLKRCAVNRMLTVLERGHWTGQPKRHNGGHGGSRPDRPVLSLQRLAADVDMPFDVEDVLAGYAVQDAVWAYHHGDLVDVLSRLTERERRYVLARFWGGLTGPELDALLATTSTNVWRTARPKLATALHHLILH